MGKIKKTVFLTITLWLFGIAVVVGQDCNILSKANDIHPDRLCAPVNVSWKITYRGVNDGGTGDVKILFDWDDSSATELIPAINISSKEWTITHTHIYPSGGDKCNYHPTVHLVIAGSSCSSSIQEQIVTVWDTDDMNGGEMVISPQTFPICYGKDGNVTFSDVSDWNCTPPDENDAPNSRKRWIQWVYGTGGTNINTAKVNGIIESYPFSSTINMTTEPILAPTAPFNQTMPIQIPAGYNVGDFFEVTLRNWNYCNPYDTIPNDGLPPTDPINGDFPPVETTAIAIIVALPDGTITAVSPLCENESPINLVAADPGGSWSGTGITNSSTGRFDPNIAGPGLHTINYDITNSDGCSTTGTTTIRVWEAPETNIINNDAAYLCPGVIETLDGNPINGTTPYTHLWSGDTSPLNNINSQTPDFSTTSIGVYNLIYTVTDTHSCTDKDTIDVHVYPVDIHFNNKDPELCTNAMETLNPEPSGGSGIYTTHLWSGGRTDLLSATDKENPTFLSPTNGLFSYEYSVTDNQGCSASDSIFIHVYNQPIAYAGTNDTICGLTNLLNATPSFGAGTWTLINGAGNIVFNNINNPKTKIDVDTYGTYTLEWSEDNNSCYDADTVIFVFYKTPKPITEIGGDTCGLSYSITVTPDIGIGYWRQKSGSGTAAFDDYTNTTTNVSVNIAGNYVFEWIESNSFGCTGTDSVKVVFHSIPSANIAPFNTVGCSPVVVDFQNNSTDANTYYWTFGDGSVSNKKNPTHTFKNSLAQTDSFAIRMIAYSSFGCTDTINKKIFINPSPISAFETDKDPGCSPLTINFNNTSAGANTYHWSLGDGTPDQTDEDVTHTFLNNETYVQSFSTTLIVKNSYNCTDTSNRYVTVYPLSKFEITAEPDTGCNPLKIDLSATPGAFSYNWVFGDGQSTPGSNYISHVYYNTGNTPTTFTTTLLTSSTFGCHDTSTVDIVVNPIPTSKFSYTPKDGCAPLLVAFNNESLNVDSTLWRFGDGEELFLPADSNITHIYENNDYSSKTIKAVLIAENSYGCQDSSSNYLTINPKVNAIIDMAGENCSPYDVTLTNSSTGANKFFWDFGDGNTSTSPIGKNIYTNRSDTAANYIISMVAKSTYGCTDTAYTKAVVYPQPESKFSYSPQNGCAPLDAEFINLSGNVSSSTWRFGDNTEEVFPGDSSTTHSYINTGHSPLSFNIMLLTENSFGCKDSSSNVTNVYPQVKAELSPGDNECSPHKVTFTNSSSNANNFFWNYGDGNTSSDYSGYNTFVNNSNKDTTFNVILTASSNYGCADTDTTTVTVYRVPKPDFFVIPEEQQLPNSTVTVTNNTLGDKWNYTWLWDDGNISTEKNPKPYTYNTYGNYDIKLIVEGEHCSDSTIKTVMILSSTPIVIYGPDTTGCPPFHVPFYNHSTSADTYMWEFGDGGVSSEKEPEYTYRYPGEYNVKLTIYGPGGTAEKDNITITVHDSPTAYFEVVPSHVIIPGQKVSFLNRSTDALSCLWNLGDGNSSTEFSFMYEYKEKGVYDVSLEVTNEKGCKDTFIQREACTAEQGGKISFPNAFTPNTSGPNGGHYTYGEKENYVFYPYVQEGIDEYTLQIYTRWGELIFESNDIKIGWDGYYRGKLSPQGAYIYKATCKYGTGLIKVTTGDVTLIR